MKKIIESSLKKYFQLRRFKVNSWKKQALETQALLLQELVSSASKTKFGQEHDFENITSLEAYQQEVPVRSYEDFYPYIKLMLSGHRDILWPGKVKFFSKSSGTSNDVSKYLPVSTQAIEANNYKAGRDLYTSYFINHPESKIFKEDGAALSINGSFEHRDDDIKVGDVSAIIASELPNIFQQRRKPSLNVALLSNWSEKIPAIIEEATKDNITHLSGVPTWFVALFDEMKDSHPYNSIRDIWPNLELFIHGAVAFEPYRSIFKKFIPHEDMNYLEVYNASEGFFAFQDNLKKAGEMLLLTDHGVFYEFIAFGEYQKGSTEALGLQNVGVGIDYAMIISTNSGLWRYDLGDLIQFTSIEPYRIKITGRTKAFINLCGEELMVGNTDTAITQISEKTNSCVEHYTVAPIFMNQEAKAGHQWIIEFKDEPDDLDNFTELLDLKLRELNSDYSAKRQDDIALQQLVISKVKKGRFMKWLSDKGKLGGQHKVPKLSQDRKIVDTLLVK